jgi:hypothetical protein
MRKPMDVKGNVGTLNLCKYIYINIGFNNSQVVDWISRKENAAEIIEHIKIGRRVSTAEITGKLTKEM